MKIVLGMKELQARLESGDESEPLVWILPRRLALAPRPLRHHSRYAGSGAVIPRHATPLLFQWAVEMRAHEVAGIISFMHDRDRHCYSELDLNAIDINEFYEKQGCEVARSSWEDPHHSKADEGTKQQSLERYRLKALAGFDELPKPVLLQCRSGIDRSAPVAAYISLQRFVRPGR